LKEIQQANIIFIETWIHSSTAAGTAWSV